MVPMIWRPEDPTPMTALWSNVNSESQRMIIKKDLHSLILKHSLPIKIRRPFSSVKDRCLGEGLHASDGGAVRITVNTISGALTP